MSDVITAAMVATTLALNPMTMKLAKNELHCLSIAVAQEARSRSRAARRAIAYATRNRVIHSHLFAETFCDVIKQPYQFSFVRHPQRSRTIADGVWSEIVEDAVEVIQHPGVDPTKGATHWCRKEEVRHVDWCEPKRALAIIDGFYFLAPDGVDKPVVIVPPGRKPRRDYTAKEVASR